MTYTHTPKTASRCSLFCENCDYSRTELNAEVEGRYKTTHINGTYRCFRVYCPECDSKLWESNDEDEGDSKIISLHYANSIR